MVGEHGDYSWNEKGQQLFPRKFFMEQICGVFAASGRAVPVFCDKHLSWNWHDASWMVDRARDLCAPFMAGSSLVTCHRSPYLEHPVRHLGPRDRLITFGRESRASVGVQMESPLEEAVAIGYSGLDICKSLDTSVSRVDLISPHVIVGVAPCLQTARTRSKCCSAWWSAGSAARAA